MKNILISNRSLGVFTALAMANAASGQVQGPSTGSTPYVLPTLPGYETTSVLTVDNTGANPDDSVGGYGMNGIPDGLGAFDNGDGTFTLVMNHEIGNTLGAVRAHGAKGAYVSKWVINKNTLAVVSGSDLMTGIYGWDTATQTNNTVATPFAFSRFCSADLPKVSAFYNAATGRGTQERIFMHGEEGGTNGYQQATVVTGPDAGKSYTLGKFNLATDHVGGVLADGVGGWENTLACPYAQDTTIAIGNNDGGTSIMANSVAVYVGTKTSTGTEVDKAGLTNGTLYFVNVAGNPLEIPAANTTTRVTNITSGTAFTLSHTASTTFSRPEDGAWNPANPSQYYFVTTDRLDQASDGLGANIGQTRLWRLNFTDITNPTLGGTIDLLIDGQTVAGEKVNMFDNMTVNESNGHVILQEDVGGAAHNGKVWDFDPSTYTGVPNSGTLKKILKHDPARFGDRAGGVTTAATLPFNNDEESSGIIDITSIMRGSSKFKGNPNEAWYISSDQAHYVTSVANPLTTAQVEGGQLFTLQDIAPLNNVAVKLGGFVRDRRTGLYAQQVTLTNNTAAALTGPFHLVLDGLSPSATLSNATGTTSVYPPTARPYITVAGGSLAAGASVTVSLQFSNPTNAAISYTARTLNSVPTP